MRSSVAIAIGLVLVLSACGRRPVEPAALGEAAADGQFSFVVTGFSCGEDWVGNEYVNDQPDGTFCFVEVAVSNIGVEARDFLAGPQRLIDAAGRTHKPDFAASWIESEKWPAFPLNPGMSATATLVFDVAAPSTIAGVELHDSPFSTGVQVAVNG